MPELTWEERPEEYRRPEVIGVFVGGCVDRGDGSSFRAKAHAHDKDPHKGWICHRGTKWLKCRELLLHEVAHVLTGAGHNDKWRKKVIDIGGTLNPVLGVMKDYNKKTYVPKAVVSEASHEEKR